MTSPTQLKMLLEVLSEYGVTSYSDGEITIEMMPFLPDETEEVDEEAPFEMGEIQFVNADGEPLSD